MIPRRCACIPSGKGVTGSAGGAAAMHSGLRDRCAALSVREAVVRSQSKCKCTCKWFTSHIQSGGQESVLQLKLSSIPTSHGGQS